MAALPYLPSPARTLRRISAKEGMTGRPSVRAKDGKARLRWTGQGGGSHLIAELLEKDPE